MIDGIYTATAGASVQIAKNDLIANNLANLSTSGFKRQMAIFAERAPESVEQGVPQTLLDPRFEKIGGGIKLSAMPTDFTPGAAVFTGNPLDLAIDKQGFFAVSDGQNTYYTRNGNFTLDSSDNVVTANGKYKLLDQGGNVVNLDGYADLNAYHAARRRIGLWGFTNPQKLEHLGEGLYKDNGAAGVTPNDSPAVNIGNYRTGYLEGSNVNPVTELVNMIEGYRAYEANMRVVRAHDAVLGRAVNDVGRIR
jgi:flagellar basal-body rod protein FlgG